MESYLQTSFPDLGKVWGVEVKYKSRKKIEFLQSCSICILCLAHEAIIKSHTNIFFNYTFYLFIYLFHFLYLPYYRHYKIQYKIQVFESKVKKNLLG